jgi:hypothetical protein
MKCFICNSGFSSFFSKIDNISYFSCEECESIFADPNFIQNDYSKNITYNTDYWQTECASSRQRSFGSTLNRVAEVFLYSRHEIKNFIDIGSGPGYLLDALSIIMPKYSDTFHGIELFPPPEKHQSKHKNYKIGSLGSLDIKFDAGCCIEVIEHLPPETLRKLINDMALTSTSGALYYFNSAQPSFVKESDPSYLDPLGRGHICSYSLKALKKIFFDYGFTLIPLPNRDWGFLVEFGEHDDSSLNFETLMTRVWNPEVKNIEKLQNNGFGPFMYTVGVESARCYYESEMSKQRTNWALSLKKQLFGK